MKIVISERYSRSDSASAGQSAPKTGAAAAKPDAIWWPAWREPPCRTGSALTGAGYRGASARPAERRGDLTS